MGKIQAVLVPISESSVWVDSPGHVELVTRSDTPFVT